MIVQLFQRHRPLPDICPSEGDGVMRWPNGDVWIPQPTPPQQSGLFGRTTRDDWQRHAMAAAAQVRALIRSHTKRGHDTASRSELAATWQQGYEAARNYAQERLGIEGGHIPDPPDNPYLERPAWDF